MDDEPSVNISGGDAGGGEFADVDADADTRAAAIVADLGDVYWEKTYGGRDAFECLVRTVLSQNTSDVASQPAHDALLDRYDPADPEDRPASDGDRESGAGSRGDGDLAEALADAHRDELAETISSAGLYNQKSETIVRLAGRICEEYDGEDGFDEFVRDADPDAVRDALLDMKGVGPKTADCVLLFAGGKPGVFPVDTHVHRIARRMGLAPPDADHEGVRAALEASVPADACGFGHTAMIQFGRDYCTARKPACLDGPEACPLYDYCDRAGVDEVTETVVDPADAD
ncbi:endonuclease III domain-containing protein [Halobacterium rubrum]|uniref:endonuclease III domain-containing protein n=1 Tax=Halobacterium TaxID=2239 RepID=UPI001F2BF1F7|nr:MULTISPECIES: endonuclease III [Halobacterium]MDH5021561.1 endonuclease III [Halobacterium rubrum]